jgi:folate-binding protein YgfZ
VISTDLQQAVHQVRASFGVAWLTGLAVLEVTGPDAPRFLQNRLTNDVLALQKGQGQLNAVLDRQAKIQGVFGLYRTDSGFRLLIDAAEQTHAVAQILKFRIVEQVQIEDLSAQIAVFSVQGPHSAEFLEKMVQLQPDQALPSQEHAWETVGLNQLSDSPSPQAWVMRRSLSGEQGFLLLVQTQQQPQAVWAALKSDALAAGGVEMTSEAQDVIRVEAGLPRYGSDYDFETLLPETGLERQAVSYTKGCYLGQETVARVKTYGMVQKALVGLLFAPASQLPPAQSPCLIEGKPVGELKSVVFSPTLKRPIALAYLGKAERIPGKILNLEIAGQIYAAEVALLPFYDAQSQKSGQALLEAGLKHFAEGYDEEAIRVLKQAIAGFSGSL